VIGSTIVAALESLNLRFPRVDKASLDEFASIRNALQREGKDKGKDKSKGTDKPKGKARKTAAG
jgi:hypothetical protein